MYCKWQYTVMHQKDYVGFREKIHRVAGGLFFLKDFKPV